LEAHLEAEDPQKPDLGCREKPAPSQMEPEEMNLISLKDLCLGDDLKGSGPIFDLVF
jgi:hypothetical protein